MFDKDGNMRQWWSNKTVEEYVNRTACFIKQYDEFYLPEVDDHVSICDTLSVTIRICWIILFQVSGERTLGENIADNGGLREAFHGYRLHMKQNGKEQVLPGFENYTHEQLFFISFGNVSEFAYNVNLWIFFEWFFFCSICSCGARHKHLPPSDGRWKTHIHPDACDWWVFWPILMNSAMPSNVKPDRRCIRSNHVAFGDRILLLFFSIRIHISNF